MAKKKIIFQGEPGANSHIACREAYPDHEPVPCPTFEDCFTAVTRGRADLAMISASLDGEVATLRKERPDLPFERLRGLANGEFAKCQQCGLLKQSL